MKKFYIHYTIAGCGGVINAEEGDGDIVSPGYPDAYRRGTNCSWLITSDHAGKSLYCHTAILHLKI